MPMFQQVHSKAHFEPNRLFVPLFLAIFIKFPSGRSPLLYLYLTSPFHWGYCRKPRGLMGSEQIRICHGSISFFSPVSLLEYYFLFRVSLARKGALSSTRLEIGNKIFPAQRTSHHKGCFNWCHMLIKFPRKGTTALFIKPHKETENRSKEVDCS